MLIEIASCIMRTTIDIDDPILKDLKRLQKREGKSLAIKGARLDLSERRY